MANVAVGMSVGIFASAASVIHLALLKRAILFTETSANDVVGRVANTAVSILLALRGWGYWALVAGIVAQQASLTVGAWWFCRWVPSLPRQTGKTGAMVRFAGKVYGNFIVAYSGRISTTCSSAGGLMRWRWDFIKRPLILFALTASQLTSPLHNVALATLSRLNEDHVLLRRYLASSLGMVAFAGMAASADLTLVGKDVVRLVLGPRWAESGRIFQIFAPGIGAMLLCSTVGWVHLSVGKPGRWLRWNIIALAATVSLFLVALPLGTLGSRRGVEYFLLDPTDSGLLVCWATDRVWYLRFDFRHLEICGRRPGGGISNCRDHPRQASFGYCFRHERRARGDHPYFNSVFHFVFGDGHPVSSRLGADAPACRSSARVGPVTEGHKNRPTNALGDRTVAIQIEAKADHRTAQSITQLRLSTIGV